MTITPDKLALIATPMTADHYPKAYAIWGDDGFERINKLLTQATLLVGRRVKNDPVAYAGLSETKSKAGIKPVVFVDTESFKRYYISERHIKQGKLPKVVQV